MKLPFLILPRSVYNDMRGDLEAAQKRNEDLQRTLLDLKLDGAQIVRYNPEFRAAHRKKAAEPDLIDEALEDHPKCRMNPEFRRRMRKWADDQLADRKAEAWVIEKIRTWDRVSATSQDDEDEEDRRMGLIA